MNSTSNEAQINQCKVTQVKEEEPDNHDESMIQEAIQLMRNHISPGYTVEITEPDIEEEHFESTYQENRLNKDIDINDVDIAKLMVLIDKKESHMKPINKAIINQLCAPRINMRVQMDSGANRSITPYKELLHNARKIEPFSINGINGTVVVNTVGMLRLQCIDDSFIWAKVYYSDEVEETIISPTDITMSSDNAYVIWDQHSNTATGKGQLTFSTASGLDTATIPLYMMNYMWYTSQPTDLSAIQLPTQNAPIIRRLTQRAEYELWHQRLGYIGETVMTNLHKCVDGTPNLAQCKHKFFKCECCMRGKVHAAPKNKSPSTTAAARGEVFHMDFGFARGSDYKAKNEKGRIITSRDGYNSYLIIVDAHTRYSWVFLSATKEPPIKTVKTFLDRYGIKEGTRRQIRCDQGGELGRSSKFREMVELSGYSVEPTSADNSSQNGIAERPNRTYGNMMRTMLLNSGLSSQFWSYALIQAVFIKNRVPHAHHKHLKTSFEMLTGRKPNLKNLKVFGSRVVAKASNDRTAKLDDNSSRGVFLHHTSTTSISKYLDDSTGREKTTSHITYGEAHYTQQKKPLGAQVLINNGYSLDTTINLTTNVDPAPEASSDKVVFKKLASKAIEPKRATSGSASYDLYAAEPTTLGPGEIKMIKTDIAIECPHNSYGRIAPKSGITVKRHLDIRAGVIDSDYRGNVIVTMHNIGTAQQNVNEGDQIAQLIIEKIVNTTLVEKDTVVPTSRGTGGLGSTAEPSSKSNVVPFEDNELEPAINSVTSHTEYIYLSDNPFGPTITIPVKVKGNHSTLGLQLDNRNVRGRLLLSHCDKGTPSARIKKWRSTLKGGNLIKINGDDVQTIAQVENKVAEARQMKIDELQLTFATEERIPIHTESGVPQLYLDQLNTIGMHLHEMRSSEQYLDIEENDMEPFIRFLQSDPNRELTNLPVTIKPKMKKKKVATQFSRKQLQKRDDWDVWHASETTQLNNYELQGTFGKPIPRPLNANILNLLWTYMIKTDTTKKARCVCNGNPKRKGSITLAHTFAACLEQPGARTFWALSAIKSLIVMGADASNAFAEAPPPKAPLYVVVDEPFRDWWREKGRGEIPPGYVMQVHHALQGHPESPRLWSIMIDGILRNHVGIHPCRHEPCLYSGEFEGKAVLFLRQVDDFAVACEDIETANRLIDKISEKLSAPMKKLGLIELYNGVNVTQTTDYVKIHSTTYLNKILNDREWINDKIKTHQNPIPMREDATYLNILDNAKGPEDEDEKEKLEQEMGFSYRSALGEILFAMITTRPDISFPVIKLRKFANNPAPEHYAAIKSVFRYL